MAWVMPVLTGVQYVMESATFVQFIQEEAIQACSLGAYLSLKARNYKAASWAITTLRGELLDHLKLANENIGWLAPYSQGAFSDFITATETNLAIYDQLLRSAAK